jgi:hypothetical protein
MKGLIQMAKAIKHHLIGNWASNKTVCGIEFKKPNIRIAQFDSNEKSWFNDFGDELDSTKWNETFCLNCLRLHETNLIEQLKMETFLIEYQLNLPKSNRLRKKKNAQLRNNRKKGIKSESISQQLESKWNPPKTKKGIQRKLNKKNNKQSKSNPIILDNKLSDKVNSLYGLPTESKCKIVNKPKKQSKPKTKPIKKENKKETKPLLNKGDIIELTEEIPIDDSFRIGDPIEDDVLELGIGTNWKLVRHNKHLDLWKLQVKSINKKNKVSKWIDDTEYCPYDFISDIINSGYCE